MTISIWILTLPWMEIIEVSNKYNIDPDLIAAIVMKESSGNSNAIRFEPSFYDKYLSHSNIKEHVSQNALKYAKRNNTTYDTEIILRSHSFGLMQVMGQTAREMGFRGEFPMLLIDKKLGLEYGTRYLTSKLEDSNNIIDAISAYNWGSVSKNENGEYYNKENYVDIVLDYYQIIKGNKNGNS